MDTKTETIRPLGDRVVVERLEAEERSPGGLFIPDNAKEKQTKGRVVAVGRGRWLESGKLVEPEVKENDIVVFPKYGGVEMSLGGKDYVVVREGDLCGVVSSSA